MEPRRERILILCKTYPSPSAKYSETSCVAGMTEDGRLLRLYPIPFRLISDEHQFRKWQWITARVRRPKEDHRPESRRVDVETLQLGDIMPTSDGWRQRRQWLEKLPVFDTFDSLEAERQTESGQTLGLLRPSRLVSLDITPVKNAEWTGDEKEKLLRLQRQGDLFNETERDLRLLKKLPYDFHYRYVCNAPEGEVEYRHKITDWEVGALYWNVRRKYGSRNWEAPFRAKIEQDLPAKDLLFLMGTMHRFPDQWLTVSLLYPPKRSDEEVAQGLLFPE